MLQLNNMHRDYNSGHFGNESVKAFTGLEIEHTLAYGKQTLFLATNEFDTDQVLELATLHNCEAVYYGANRTFQYNIGTHVFQIKKLKLHHDYLNRKVAEVTELRLHDRSIESKTILMRLKKEKLALKDQITELEKQLVKK